MRILPTLLVGALLVVTQAQSPAPRPTPSSTPVARFPSAKTAPISCAVLADNAHIANGEVTAASLGALFTESLKERGLVDGHPLKEQVVQSLNDVLGCFG